MDTYISYDEFLERFAAELLNLSSADVPYEDNEIVIMKVIEDASHEMDLDLSRLYNIDELREIHHPDLIRICADISFYNLLKRKGIATHKDKEIYYNAPKQNLFEIGSHEKELYGVDPDDKNFKGNTVSYIFDNEIYTSNTMSNWENF